MIYANVTPEQFKQQLDERFKIKTDNAEVDNFVKRMDYDQRGLINLFSWNGLIEAQTLVSDLFRVPNLKTGRMERIINALSPEEEEMFRNMMRRVHTIAQAATERDVRILVDAEQTYFQLAINRITLELMRKYNKEKAIIFNTYQCYLKVPCLSQPTEPLTNFARFCRVPTTLVKLTLNFPGVRASSLALNLCVGHIWNRNDSVPNNSAMKTRLIQIMTQLAQCMKRIWTFL